MGPALCDLLPICDNKFDIITIINISIDLINQIEIIHDCNIIQGDIKLSNIWYGNLSNTGEKIKELLE